MRWRVKDILEPIAEQWRGTGLDLSCTSGQREALKAYNRLNEVMMNHRNWPGTEVTVAFAVKGGCITLPARFGAITGILIDGYPAPINSMGWEFVDGGGWESHCSCADGALQHLGNYFPTVNEMAEEAPVGIYSDKAEDPAARCVITGLDASNKVARYSLPIVSVGQNSQHEINSPMITAGPLKTIESISKPRTNGYVEVFAWKDGTNYWLSRLAPGEESPALTRYRLAGRQWIPSIRARVALQFTPLHDPEDISLIQHREAYRLMAQSLSYRDDGDVGNASAYENKAMKMLTDSMGKTGIGQRFAIGMAPRQGAGRPLNLNTRYRYR